MHFFKFSQDLYHDHCANVAWRYLEKFHLDDIEKNGPTRFEYNIRASQDIYNEFADG